MNWISTAKKSNFQAIENPYNLKRRRSLSPARFGRAQSKESVRHFLFFFLNSFWDLDPIRVRLEMGRTLRSDIAKLKKRRAVSGWERIRARIRTKREERRTPFERGGGSF